MTTPGYTTLEHLKRSLNNGELPVMTPVAEKAKAFIDPAFVLGQGGLQEDDKRGLRCPARGCGGYFHDLSSHWSQKHGKTIGPSSSLRRALGMRPKTPLRSSAFRAKIASNSKASAQRRDAASYAREHCKRHGYALAVSRAGEARSANTMTMEARNLRNTCDAQMRKRYVDATARLGHDPSARDLGHVFMHAVQKHYGTLNAFRATIGVAPVATGTKPNSRWSEDDVIEAIEVWYKAHGRLPSCKESERRDHLPYLPTARHILLVLGINSWPVAMSHVAWLLGIEDPNYSPKSKEAA